MSASPPLQRRQYFVVDLGPGAGGWFSPGAAGIIAECLEWVARANGTPLAPGSPVGELYRVAKVVASTPSAGLPPAAPERAYAGDEISPREAAELLEVTPDHVRLLARRGQLPGARRTKKGWRIPRAVVVAYADHRDADRTNT